MIDPQFILFNPTNFKTSLEHLFIIVFAFVSLTAFWAAYYEPYQRKEYIVRGVVSGIVAIGIAIFTYLTT